MKKIRKQTETSPDLCDPTLHISKGKAHLKSYKISLLALAVCMIAFFAFTAHTQAATYSNYTSSATGMDGALPLAGSLILLLLAGLFNIRHKLFERKGNGVRTITSSELSEQQPLVPENGHPSPAHLSFFDNNPMPMLICDA